MTDPSGAIVELAATIAASCDVYGAYPRDLCLVGHPDTIDTLKRNGKFPSIAICYDEDIEYKNTIYVVPRNSELIL